MAQPADMRTCEIDPGSPGAVVSTDFCARLAQHYGLPSRGGTAPNAKEVSVLSGLESMMINLTASNAGINLIVHAAGLLDRYNCMSPEQLLMDMEIIRRVEYYKNCLNQDSQGSLASIYFPEIKKVGPGGHFLNENSTLSRCRTEPFITQIQNDPADTSLSENKMVKLSLRKQVEQMLEAYQPPEIGAEKRSKMRDLLINFGVPVEVMDRIDHQYIKCLIDR
jgi:trimethylamine--corrinoid protein Co-methyltransferase